MDEMFSYCISLNNIDISNFNTSSLESCYYMFNKCKDKLKSKIYNEYEKFGDGYLDDY
jgi:surface protein